MPASNKSEKKPRRERRRPIVAVDLFCGVGGLTYGLRTAGVRVAAGIDIDSHCDYLYHENNPGAKFLHKDVGALTATEINKLFPKNSYRVLVGCAPCQAFSKYARAYKPSEDRKWALVKHFGELVKATQPDVVSMENVPELEAHEVYTFFVDTLKGCGYNVSSTKVYCPSYGVPQQRQRLVVLASKFGDINLIPPTHTEENYPTVRSFISTLEPLASGETSVVDPVHKCSKMSPLNLARVRASTPGGTWRDWDIELRAACHTIDTGASYPSVYGRMEWDKPSPTITTQYYGFGNGRFGHPEQDRGISLREGALLQSFPSNYVLHKPDAKISIKSIGRMVGNAVPPKLGEAIGRTIIEHIELHSQNSIN